MKEMGWDNELRGRMDDGMISLLALEGEEMGEKKKRRRKERGAWAWKGKRFACFRIIAKEGIILFLYLTGRITVYLL